MPQEDRYPDAAPDNMFPSVPWPEWIPRNLAGVPGNIPRPEEWTPPKRDNNNGGFNGMMAWIIITVGGWWWVKLLPFCQALLSQHYAADCKIRGPELVVCNLMFSD